MASRPAILNSLSLPSYGTVLPTSIVPSTPLVVRSCTEA